MDNAAIPPIIRNPHRRVRRFGSRWNRARGASPLAAASFLWWSLPLFRISGISIRVHPTFALLLAFFAWEGYHDKPGGWIGASLAVLLVCLVFVCVCLHELGHSLVAQRFGVEVQSITLLPIGGVAALKRIPEDPLQEIAITVAGPMVNLFIATVLAFWLGLGTFMQFKWLAPPQLQDPIGFLLYVNAFMFLFNLIPAFPMDGGRLLRALLAFKLPYARATSIAAAIGQGIAVLFILSSMGFFSFSPLKGPMVMVIGLFIMFAASNEERIVKARSALANVRASQIMRRSFESLSPSDTVSAALPKLFHNEQDVFPILFDGHLEGFVTRQMLVSAMRNGGLSTPLVHIMESNVRPIHPQETGVRIHEQVMTTPLGVAPVIEDGRLVGLITSNTLNRCISMGDAFLASLPSDTPQPPLPPESV